jgi:hypothetical protein
LAINNNGVITITAGWTLAWMCGGLLSLALTATAVASPFDHDRGRSGKETVKLARDAVTARPGRQVAAPANKEPFGSIPKGPLQIIISIDHQTLHLYSDGEKIAETLVATGVAAHPTPMGVFSVIQKSRDHHSNIYSGAPMPFMHRITWSGVALHEGVGMGHPASHGCIRLSRDFVTRLWGISRLGARVVIARQQLSPQEFADPHLFVHTVKHVTPSAQVAPAAAVKTAQSLDSNNSTDAPPVSASADPMPVLSRQGSDADLSPVVIIDPGPNANPDMAPARADQQPQTAPAKAMLAPGAAAADPDAKPNSPAVARDESPEPVTAPALQALPAASAGSQKAMPAAPPAAALPPPAVQIPAEAAPVQTPATAQASSPPQTTAGPQTSAASQAAPVAQSQTPVPTPPAQSSAPVSTPAATAATPPEVKPQAEAKHDPAPADLRGAESSDGPPAVTAIPDDVPLPLPKPADVAHAPQNAPIAVFISRKEKKIFVRQDFSPLFDAPVTIEDPDRPLGTMVFTALNFLDDHSTLRWNVILVPDQRPMHKGEAVHSPAKPAVANPMADKRGRAASNEIWTPPETPERALARIEIAPDAVARISELIVPGSSLVISDQGLGEETGEGTDFIVVTH